MEEITNIFLEELKQNGFDVLNMLSNANNGINKFNKDFLYRLKENSLDNDKFAELFFKSLIKDIYENMFKCTINYEIIFGNIMWCISGIFRLYNYETENVLMRFNLKITEMKNKNIKLDSLDKIDEFMMVLFDDKKIEDLIGNISNTIKDEDKNKYIEIIENFNNSKYHTCALLLSGLIDSLSIKKVLLDSVNHKYIFAPGSSDVGVGQGAKAYLHALVDLYPSYFGYDDILANKARTSPIRKRNFENKIASMNVPDQEKYELLNIIGLTYCILILFDDNDWKDYLNNKKPKIINRHWLNHGMCNVDEITKSDCIKLLLILQELLELYK